MPDEKPADDTRSLGCVFPYAPLSARADKQTGQPIGCGLCGSGIAQNPGRDSPSNTPRLRGPILPNQLGPTGFRLANHIQVGRGMWMSRVGGAPYDVNPPPPYPPTHPQICYPQTLASMPKGRASVSTSLKIRAAADACDACDAVSTDSIIVVMAARATRGMVWSLGERGFMLEIRGRGRNHGQKTLKWLVNCRAVWARSAKEQYGQKQEAKSAWEAVWCCRYGETYAWRTAQRPKLCWLHNTLA